MTQSDVFQCVARELASASRRFPAMRSAHEGYAILLEEVEEAWDDIKSGKNARREMVQVAAMAMRWLLDSEHW